MKTGVILYNLHETVVEPLRTSKNEGPKVRYRAFLIFVDFSGGISLKILHTASVCSMYTPSVVETFAHPYSGS